MLNRRNIWVVLTVLSGTLFSQLQVKNYFSVTGKKDVAVNTIAQDFTGFLWLGTVEGLYKFDGKQGVPAIKDNAALKSEISALYFDGEETLWIGTKSGKVYFLKKNKLDSISFAAMPNTEKITSFAEVSGGMCIGTYGSGIYAYAGGKLQHFNSDTGLSDNVVYRITGDKKNTIWCGTDAGITQVTDILSRPAFKIISNKNGLPDNIVRDISLDNDRLLIAMQDSGVCYYNLSKAAIEKNPFFNNWTLGPVANVTQNKGKLTLATEKNGSSALTKASCTGITTTATYKPLPLTSCLSTRRSRSGSLQKKASASLTTAATASSMPPTALVTTRCWRLLLITTTPCGLAPPWAFQEL